MERTETIKIDLNKELRDALIFEAKRAYGDIELEKAILNILEEWVNKVEQGADTDQFFEETEESLDACIVPNDKKKFFELTAPAVEARILGSDYQIDFLHWNGNRLENTIRARAQVIHILEPKDYPALGKKLFKNILNAVEHGKEVI